MSNSLHTLTIAQLKQAVAIKEQIAVLEQDLAAIFGQAATPAAAAPASAKKKFTMSASAKAAISQAAKARWAKIRAAKTAKVVVAPKPASKTVPAAKAVAALKPTVKKWKLSAAGLAKIKAANKAYWATKKAAKK